MPNAATLRAATLRASLEEIELGRRVRKALADENSGLVVDRTQTVVDHAVFAFHWAFLRHPAPDPALAVLLPLHTAGRLAKLLATASGWLIGEPTSADLYRSAGLFTRAAAAFATAGQQFVGVPAPSAMQTSALCRQAAVQVAPTNPPLAAELCSMADALGHRAEAVA